MATTPAQVVAELLGSLGGIPPHRVILPPAPGTATERDLYDLHERTNRPYELVNGTIVERAFGFDESRLAMELVGALYEHVQTHDLGRVWGCGVLTRLSPGVVQLPDVAFIPWGRYPRKPRRREMPTVVPDLVVEVLRKDNTRKEMQRKLEEYFRAGVRLVWYVDPIKRTVRVYTASDRSTLLGEGDTLDGGDVLPGFALSIRDWFAEAERTGPRQP